MLTSLNNIPVNYRGWTLQDFLERLPREWIYEELMETLEDKGVHLSPTM
jgi:E3 ubiquitin-protein ligase KEG